MGYPCGTTQRQFRDFQIHFVRQHFGSSGRAASFSRHTKLPFLLRELAPEFWREERRTPAYWEENRIERTTENPRTLARQSNAKVGAAGSPSERVPELPGFSGAEEFLAAACQVSADRRTSGVERSLGVSVPLEAEEVGTMAYPRMDEMLWFGGHWWWFPGRQITLESRFEWRGLLEPDGSVAEGILFVGEVATE
jgi:hypothetical protein